MRNRRLPSLNALRTLEALYETGSITAAADRLSVSHSAVSHQLKLLQNWVGSPLVIRMGRSVALTPAGESLASVVHASFSAIRHELDLVPLRLKRSFEISAVPIVAQEIILPRLHQFVAKYPHISLHVSLGLTDKTPTANADIEIGFRRQDRLQIGENLLLPGTAVPVASPKLIERYDGDLRETLRNAPLIADEDARMWNLWQKQHGLLNAEKSREPSIYLEGALFLMDAAREGLGITLARRAMLGRSLEKGQLRILSEKAIDRNWIYFIRPAPEKSFEPELQKVVNWLFEITEPERALEQNAVELAS